VPRTPDEPTDPDAKGQPDDPVAEAADPVNPDPPPGSPDGDEIHDAMLAENRDATGRDERDEQDAPDR
jgi:hypothetical protein